MVFKLDAGALGGFEILSKFDGSVRNGAQWHAMARRIFGTWIGFRLSTHERARARTTTRKKLNFEILKTI
jgi:hypothetical protein